MSPVAVHDPHIDQMPGLGLELVAVSSTDPELVLHRYVSRDASGLVKIPTANSIALARATTSKSAKDVLADTDKGSPCSDVCDEGVPTLVDFEPGDPTDPHNFSPLRKKIITLAMICTINNSTFASSVSSGASKAIKADFGCSSVLTTLLVTLYMIGFVVGPSFWAPMSEYIGRRYVLFASCTFYLIFTIACAVSPNIGALLAFRFLQGLNATCPISVSGGVFADIYVEPIKRGRAVAVFCGFTILGSLFGPFIAGYVSTSHLGWRWAFWITAIMAAAALVFLIAVLPETFRPVLIMRRAQKMRDEGLNVVSAYDLQDQDVKGIFMNVILRPVRMLFSEPIVAAICVYVGFIYGIFYIFFLAYPIIFQDERGMSPGKGGLMLLPIAIGAIATSAIHYRYDVYVERLRNSGVDVPVERDRLPVTICTAWCLPIALFWLAWTSYQSVPFGVVMLGGIFFGLGFTSLFIGFLNYVTDCYKIYAASAHGIMSMTRSILASCFPLFAPAMYNGIGVHWATTIFAILAALMAPIPILFYKYGPYLRAHSKFAATLATQNNP
ncbi:major facilitator superfamily domain-containing protein [Limtongia smithiae]|uniref:major facilitator superfamily domain-containing protein n=1 Tax=Limtongia smithiae TaxID=1125753 RepID=UPI0034CDB52A